MTEGRVQLRRVLAGAVAVIGLYQAGVPLIARGVFGAEQRLAPAAALPAPWWWLTCAALTVLTALALLTLAPRDPLAEDATSNETAEPREPGSDDATDQGWEALSGFVVLVALYNGVAPFVARFVFGGDLLLALPLYLPAPWWWLAAGTVLIAAAAALVTIDRARHRSDDLEGDPRQRRAGRTPVARSSEGRIDAPIVEHGDVRWCDRACSGSAVRSWREALPNTRRGLSVRNATRRCVARHLRHAGSRAPRRRAGRRHRT